MPIAVIPLECFFVFWLHMFMLYFYYVAYPRQLFIFLSMPHPTSLDSTNFSLFEFQALPMNPLILLASAQNLVTTGTRTLLAERIFEHEPVNEHGPQRINLHAPAPPMPPSNPLYLRTFSDLLQAQTSPLANLTNSVN